ncbi:acetate--CoA ligase family protein [Mycobacterium montefiorense]|uniref:CoA-binding protein n=1 Tax=Mycobacterium montefiorense TaxID=154654 RepID=A0AA37UMB7_9MYCO|nr:acetate--CoA ligase family protein [Mycobacterium montefiorense]GBG38336.1 CoA-binding protein [Mycobacterium montefiorense]GKU34165.1 CoA-binding protein [Mycobacterium montefiorense]GKU38783.1 CoA-binding protein [Mycobacterium montefiorense]GKU48180.1 CoA-binding protein [Mycobacterium montefiorense]GKU57347.1 CoA-binding protein [Mycobacterium montefiorense]
MSRDLTSLFNPSSIAVVGASTDPAKWGNAVAMQARRGAYRHRIQLVNRSGGEILGQPMVRSIAELDGPIDLAVIAVPEAGFEAAVDGVLAKGARAIVAITAGLGEAGELGRARENALIARVRDAGAVLVGPNCLGLVDNTTATYLSSNQFAVGDVALLSQSGNLAIELDQLFAVRGLGISRFVSLGNQTDVNLVELIDDCAAHPETSAIAVYIEDFRDGRGFVDAAAAAVRSGTPVVVLAAGASTAAARGAQSHTGSLTSDSAVITAACAVAGATLVRTPRELADVLCALRQRAVPRGRRVAVLTDGGGHGVIACDVAEAAGLDVPALSEPTQTRLRQVLWSQSHVSNPVDLAGAGEMNPDSYARAFAVLQECDEVDAILMTGYFGGYSSGEDGLTGLGPAECAAAKQIAADAAGAKPTAVQSIFPDAPATRALRDGGVPVFAAIEDAATALAAVTGQASTATPLKLPKPAQPVTATDYMASRRAFTAAGIEFAAAREIRTIYELRTAAEELSPPFVLKALGLLHKSDAGGVVVGLASRELLVNAHARLAAKLSPPSFSVEEMADLANGVELIVGASWDSRFGPTVLVGMGGTATEVLRDVQVALAPIDEATAMQMLKRLRTAPLLRGHRGKPAVNVSAAARTIARFSQYAAAHPEIAELEINPLLVTPSGATALDARIVKHY